MSDNAVASLPQVVLDAPDNAPARAGIVTVACACRQRRHGARHASAHAYAAYERCPSVACLPAWSLIVLGLLS